MISSIINNIKKSLALIMWLFLFSLFRIFLLLALDANDMKISILIFLITILSISLLNCNSFCGKSIKNTLLNAILVNACSICISDVLMFFIPLILKIIPGVNIISTVLLQSEMVVTIITGILWGLVAAISYIVIGSLPDTGKHINNIKILIIIVLTIFNFVFSFVKDLGFKKILKPKNMKKIRKFY